MTEPTDSEIIALADETRTAEGGANGYVLPISFARAVLDKWGTPQPTQAQAAPQSGAKSFQTYAEANAYSRGYYAGKKAATQAQAGAVPLTDAVARNLVWSIESAWNRSDDVNEDDAVELIRATEAAHGIKGGQHGDAKP